MENSIGNYDIVVDFDDIGKKSRTEIRYSENDVNSAKVSIKCQFRGVNINLSNCDVLVRIQAGENNIEDSPSSIDTRNSLVEYTLPTNALINGINHIEIMIVKGDWIKTSPKIYYKVFDGIDESDVLSDVNYPILISLVRDVQILKDEVLGLKESVISVNDNISNAESVRVQSENIRISNENSRVSSFNNMQESVSSSLSSVDNSLNEMSALKNATELVKNNTESVRVATESVKNDTDSVRIDTLKIKDDTLTVKNQTLEVKNATGVVKDETLVVKNNTESVRVATEGVKKQAEDKIVDCENRMTYIEDNFDRLVDGTGFASVDYVDGKFDVLNSNKANKSDVYTKAETTILINSKPSINDSVENTSTVWSSKKTKTEIEVIQNELKESENTKYTTVNGVKEFECNSGYVDNIHIQGETKILDSSNQEVQAGVDGARLVSVGQGDKIEVLSYSGVNLFDGNYKNGGLGADGLFIPNTNGTTNNQALVVEPHTTYYITIPTNLDCAICLYNASTNLTTRTVFKGVLTFTTGANDKYLNFFIATNTVGYSPHLKTVIIKGKYDKKQISTTLRSLPNGVKDEIVQQGDRYYKIVRCGEFVFTSNDNYFLINSLTNTIRFGIAISNLANKPTEILCNSDRFIPQANDSWNVDREQIDQDNLNINIRINKSKLSTHDANGFKAWLQANPVTVVYELATPQIIEIPNPNPRTFADKTTFLLNTGVVQGEANFEVTNSMGSALEVMADKVSSLDDSVNPNKLRFDSSITFFNGWTHWGDALRFNAFTVGNFVKICILLKPGVRDAYTKIFSVPNQYKPTSKEFITCCSASGTSYSGCLDTDGYFIFDNSLAEESWVSVNLSYPLPRK